MSNDFEEEEKKKQLDLDAPASTSAEAEQVPMTQTRYREAVRRAGSGNAAPAVVHGGGGNGRYSVSQTNATDVNQTVTTTTRKSESKTSAEESSAKSNLVAVNEGKNRATRESGTSSKKDADGTTTTAYLAAETVNGEERKASRAAATGTMKKDELAGALEVKRAHGDGHHERESGAHAGYSTKTGVKAGASVERVDGDRHGDHEARGSEIEYDDHKLAFHRSDSRQTKDETGVVHNDSLRGGAKVGLEGAELDLARTRKTGEQTTTSSGTLSFDEHGVGATGKISSNETSATMGGKIGDDGGQLTAGVNQGKTNISGSAQFKVHAEQPRFDQASGVYLVDWRKETTLGGSVGTKNLKAGANIGGQETTVETGTAVFASLPEAKAFADAAMRHVSEMHGPPTTASQVAGMRVGEVRSRSQGDTRSVSGNASAGPIEIGGGVSAGSSAGVTVHRISATQVEVTIDKSEFVARNASAGGYGSSVAVQASRSASHELTIGFDIGTADGAAALDEFLKPSRTLLPAAKVVRGLDERSQSDGSALKFLGPVLGQQHDHRLTERRGFDETGSSYEAIGEDSVASKGKIPLIAAFEDNEKTTLDAKNDHGKATYDVSAMVQSNSGQASADGLTRATGVGHRDAGKSSGAWEVTSHFTEQDIQEFVGKVLNGSLQSNSKTDYSKLPALRAALAKAHGDIDLEMRAIARFVADTGPDGIAAIRENVSRLKSDNYHGHAQQDFDLKLANDRNFTGPTFRQNIEARIANYQIALGAPHSDLGVQLSELGKDENELDRRLTEIEDPRRYTDLPLDIRNTEVARTKHYLGVLAQLRTQMLGKLEEQGSPKSLDQDNREILYAQGTVGPVRLAARSTFDDARTSRYYFHYVTQMGKTAAMIWGDRAEFKDAEHAFMHGQIHWLAANDTEKEVHDLENQRAHAISDAETAARLAHQIVAKLKAAADQFSLAITQFSIAERNYQKIRHMSDHPNGGEFMGYGNATSVPEGGGTDHRRDDY